MVVLKVSYGLPKEILCEMGLRILLHISFQMLWTTSVRRIVRRIGRKHVALVLVSLLLF